MTQERITKKVHATSIAKGMWQGKPNISLDIPEFKSEYPIIVNSWPEGLRDQLQEGEPATLVLERQALRKNRDGSADWHYYWVIKGLADSKTKDTGRGPSGQEPRWEDLSTTRDEKPASPGPDRQDLIMLQNAMGHVTLAYGDFLRMFPDKAPDTFADYLKNVAMGATWVLHQVYQKGGYASVRGQDATPTNEPDAEEGY